MRSTLALATILIFGPPSVVSAQDTASGEDDATFGLADQAEEAFSELEADSPHERLQEVVVTSILRSTDVPGVLSEALSEALTSATEKEGGQL